VATVAHLSYAELLLLCDCDFKVEVNSYQYCHHF